MLSAYYIILFKITNVLRNGFHKTCETLCIVQDELWGVDEVGWGDGTPGYLQDHWGPLSHGTPAR